MRRLIHRYLEHLEADRNLSPHTVRAYESDLLRFLDFLAGDFLSCPPEEVQPAAVDGLAVRSFLASLHTHGLSRRSQARALAAVRGLLGFACREGTLTANPAQGVPTPKLPKTLPRHLLPGEVEALIEAPAAAADALPGSEPAPGGALAAVLARRDRAVLELLYAAGLRVGELVGLDWGSIDLPARVVRVLGKGGKERMVPFGRPAATALRRWLEDWEAVRAALPESGADASGPAGVRDEPVFLNHRGGRLSDRSIDFPVEN